ncbi:MAG: hypothetical protein GY789_27795 [Hyphomicrobiales bacterium]|nr:hypothetical protein [Hyphomicrobiales bacterium]
MTLSINPMRPLMSRNAEHTATPASVSGTVAGTSRFVEQTGSHIGQAAIAVLLAILVAKISLLIAQAINSQYLMDEYAMINQALVVDERPYVDVWPNRTLLFAYLYRTAFWLEAGTVEIIRFARLESLAVALASLAVLYQVARGIGRTPIEALLVLCVALSFSSYMEWAYMVRPEPLALLFAIAALWVLVRRSPTGATIVLAGVISGLAFLVTQKAIYFNVALGVALVGEALWRRAPWQAFRSGALLLAGWMAVFILYVAVFAIDGADPLAVIDRVLFGPPAQGAARGHASYINLWVFPLRSLLRNAPLYLVCLIGWLVVVVSFRNRSSTERIAMIFTAVITTFIFVVHRAPWPYNFIMALPFVALWAPLFLEIFHRCPRPIKILTSLTAVLVLSTSFARNIDYLDHSNTLQNATAARAERLLGPEDRYFDGVHMIVGRDHATKLWLQRSRLVDILTSASTGDFTRIEKVMAQSPKLWILNYRTAEIRQPLSAYLDDSYVPIGGNLKLTGIGLSDNVPRRFLNWWSGEYRLYDASGRPSNAQFMVDGGAAVSGPVTLETGNHEIQLTWPAPKTSYLLPSGLDLEAGLDSPAAPVPLFPAAHSF